MALEKCEICGDDVGLRGTVAVGNLSDAIAAPRRVICKRCVLEQGIVVDDSRAISTITVGGLLYRELLGTFVHSSSSGLPTRL